MSLNKTNIYTHIQKSYKKLKLVLVFLSFISVILSLLAIFFAYFSKDVINAAIASNQNQFMLYAIIISSILLFNLILTTINRYLTAYYKSDLSKHLKSKYFDYILKAKTKPKTQEHSGVLMTYLESDIEIISNEVIDIIPKTLFYTTRFIGAFILLFILDALFSLIFVALGCLLVLMSRIIAKPMKKKHLKLQLARSDARSFMQESIENIDVIKSFQAEQRMSRLNIDKQENLFKSKLQKEVLNILSSTGLSVFFAFGYAFSIIFGAYRLQTGLTVGGLLAMIQLVSHIQSPFNGISRIIPKYADLSASAQRLSILDQYEQEKPYHQIDEKFQSLTIKDLSFSYEQDLVIDQLSLTIHNQEFIHILGKSGKGKSTLFKLLLGLIDPNDGHMSIKTDKKTYDISNQTRSFMTYVPQNFLILSGTIRDNLNLFETYDDKKIFKALQIAELDTFIKALPLGLDTVLKEKGQGLSHGQIQRLAIARSLLKPAPILLLDEITSALDKEIEINILRNIKALTDKTVIISSHKEIENELITKTIEL